jgi:hypothetical protein
MNPHPIPDYFKPILVYCADPSHTADPVGPTITDPNPAVVLPDDVYVVSWVVPWDGAAGSSGGWVCLHTYGQERQLLEDRTLLPPNERQTRHKIGKATRTSWSPRCRRCGQRGGRWTATDRDVLFTRLANRGVTGVSLRALDLHKHGARERRE